MCIGVGRVNSSLNAGLVKDRCHIVTNMRHSVVKLDLAPMSQETVGTKA